MQNEMRDRLAELLKDAEGAIFWDSSDRGFIEKIADHLIANGVILPLVKVGRKVYIIDESYDSEEPDAYVLDVKINAIGYDLSGFWITMSMPLGLSQSGYSDESSFGKTVFLTREEADKKLEELKNG